MSVGPIGVSVPAGPSGALPHAGRRPGSCRCSGTSTFSPEICGKRPVPRERRVADGREAVHERLPELAPVSVRITVAIAERQHGEHLAPGDLAGRLARARRARTRRSCRRPPELVQRSIDAPGIGRASRRRRGCPSPTRSAASGRAGCRTAACRSRGCAAARCPRSPRRRSPCTSGARRHAQVLGDAGRAAGPGDVAALRPSAAAPSSSRPR